MTPDKVRYCLPIIATSSKQVRQKISEHGTSYDYLEIWVDYLTDRKAGFLRELALELPGKMLFLLRRKNLEPIKMSLPERLEVIQEIEGTNSYLDLDIYHQHEELVYLREKKPDFKVILSYHNYVETPANSELQEIVGQIMKWQPIICKVSTLCQDERAALRLLGLALDLRERGQRFIVLGMGLLGAITRIFGTLWGNEMVFAPKKGQESAPGQLTREELEQVFAGLFSFSSTSSNFTPKPPEGAAVISPPSPLRGQ